MFKIITASLLLLSIVSVQAADVSKSELKLRGCLSLVYSSASSFKGASKDVTKLVSSGTKQCRDAVRAEAKNERAAKANARIVSQIAKLQAKLKAN
jgi:hypothetical protein